MANPDHIGLLLHGVDAWNGWRQENPDIRPDLSKLDQSLPFLTKVNLSRANLTKADLSELHLNEAYFIEANLTKANLSRANLSEAKFGGANLTKANLSGAYLPWANLIEANLTEANLSGGYLERATLSRANLTKANLSEADLTAAYLSEAKLIGANLSEAKLRDANFTKAKLSRANLSEADLRWADLSRANLTKADLRGASLEAATLLKTDLTGADLTGCRTYGVSAWGLKLERAKQQNLVITPKNKPAITVDNIEIAQFTYILLNNKKIRGVIDTITSKAVLILGRFTGERKAVLDAIREELRKRDYVPILFDFDVPAERDITETVSLLARMARFIIADLTDPSSIPKELEAIVPHLAVPVQPLLEGSSQPFAMFKDLRKYDWVLPVYRYEGLEQLLPMLPEKVIAPSEEKVKALQERRRLIEAELTKPQ
jgi:uncharacterized protein YjbI with pentapeptide repeats